MSLSYDQAIEFLYQLRTFGTKLGLDKVRHLASLVGNPQDKLRFIHVAGTNGKGSTCAFLESIYRASGLKVGLFTSPHLISFTERMQINRMTIPEAEVARELEEMLPLLKQFAPEGHPTFFEVITVMALKYFARHECDLVVWETGMGGRLDATNVVTPLVSVVTTIDWDHEKWLGHDLRSIAAEKAGITKPSIPLVSGVSTDETVEIFALKAAEMAAPLHLVDRVDPRLSHIHLGIPGKHQLHNASIALKVVDVLQGIFPIRPEIWKSGLEQASWPGRLQRCSVAGQSWILDGAHNLAGVKALSEALQEEPAARILILGILKDKRWEEMCQQLVHLCPEIWVVPVESDRTAEPGELKAVFHTLKPSAKVRQFGSLNEALEQAKERSMPVVITGSLYLVGQALQWLGLGASSNERHLNESMKSPH